MRRPATIPATILATAVLLVALDVYAGALKVIADAPPPGGWGTTRGLTIGPSMAWVGGKEMENTFAPGLELTYFHRINTPLFAWISPGARLWIADGGTGVIPYIEAGLSFLFFNAGVGYGMGFLTPNVPAHSVHGFFGVAIPIWTPKKGHLLYVEPYYRPTWNVSTGDDTAGHELGMMIKWLFGFPSK